MNGRRWRGRVVAVAVTGLAYVGFGGNASNADSTKYIVPKTELEAASTIRNEPIPWQPARISISVPAINLSGYKNYGQYIIYSNGGDYPVIKNKIFYYAALAKSCKILPVLLDNGLFYQSCLGNFGLEGTIINFDKNLIYGGNFIFLGAIGQEIRLLIAINAQVRIDHAPIPYPEFSILDFKKNIIYTYGFGRPSSRYK